jgi:SEC-C motif-containing protein
MKNTQMNCPCGSNQKYSDCCGRYLDGGETARTAEALMRSRYCAYVQEREKYLLATWHPSTRPSALSLAEDKPAKWIGLDVKRHEQQDAEHAIVEFVARYKVNGRAHRLHEVSRFVRESGRWFYVDGDVAGRFGGVNK